VARRLAIVLAALAAIAPLAVAGAAAPAPGDALIAQARELAGDWGRCPTARPAARVLAQAERTSAPRPRVRRARAAVRAWHGVARDCARPVPQPTVTPG
jgi:hypothetical protein